MFRRVLCLLLALILPLAGLRVLATTNSYIHIRDLTFPAPDTGKDDFFLIFTLESDLPDAELYDHSFTHPDGAPVTENFTAGSTYCLWLYLRSIEGEALPDCDILVEDEPAEEIVAQGNSLLIKKTFTIPATQEDAPEDPDSQLPVPTPSTPPAEEAPPTQTDPTDPPVPVPEPTRPPVPTETTTPETDPTDPPQTEPTEGTSQEVPPTPMPTPEIPDAEEPPQAEPSRPETISYTRIAGADRYQTAFAVAGEEKSLQKADTFSCVVVASGTSYPDALSGSYLAAVKRAPILLVKPSNMENVKDYIRQHLTPGGTVYLLGGEKAVPKAMETGLDAFSLRRLGGADRYETNLLILREAGIARKDVLICTGSSFADSLSASAVGLPILLVKDSLTLPQRELLLQSSGRLTVLGGVNAVSQSLQEQLAALGKVSRLGGSSRYETSLLVARTFFSGDRQAVIASGKTFPDGLTGGPLAFTLGAPLILCAPGREKPAASWIESSDLTGLYILGGTNALPQSCVDRLLQGG